jgi:transposase
MKSKEEVVWKGKKVFVGIDIHQKSWTVTGVCEGEQVLHRTIEPRYEVLERQLRRFRTGGAKIIAVYEAGCFGYRLYDELKEAGIKADVAAPSKILRAASERVKTDKRDSRKLATHLSQGMLHMVPVPSFSGRIERGLVRGRKQLVEQATQVKLKIKSILRFFGYIDKIGRWTKVYKRQLREISKSKPELDLVGIWLDVLEKIEAKQQEVDKKIQRMTKSQGYRGNYRRLLSIPGVGEVTAITVLTELQSFKPFRSGSKVASYVGLVPGEHSSGERQRQGPITKTGNRWVRAVLIEAAWSVIVKDGVMQTHYRKIVGRNGNQGHAKQKAIVAVARKLLVRMYAIIKNDQDYAVGLVA